MSRRLVGHSTLRMAVVHPLCTTAGSGNFVLFPKEIVT